MASPQPIRRKPLNPLIDPEQAGASLDVINGSSRHDPMTAENALLEETRVKSGSNNNHQNPVIRGVARFGWGWEVLAWVTSLISLIAIFGILLGFDHKPLPQWPHSITLNTVIAIFSQISATALSIPLSECVSQLKWLWFTRRNRPLYDFDTFDKASRGPWSSLVLIWKTNASHLASFGALLIILNLAFQPFTQQAVTFSQRPVVNGTAVAQATYKLTSVNLQGGLVQEESGGAYILPTTVASIYAGLNGGVNLSQVVPYCPTGNCTWIPYDSLALCANPIANLTHLLTKGVDANGNGNYSLPNGASISEMPEYANIVPTSIQGATKPIAFSDIPFVLDFVMIYLTESFSYAALEASLSFCGQTYNTSVESGRVNTTELHRWGQLNTTSIPGPEEVQTIASNSTTLAVSLGYLNALEQTLSSTFVGSYSSSPDGSKIYGSIFIQAISTAMFSSPNKSFDDLAALQTFMDGVAISMSNNFRTGIGSFEVQGQSYGLETYVIVDWFWLIFPSCIVLFTFIFLLATIVKSSRRRTMPWKSSTLAVLGGLDIETAQKLGGLASISTIEERSKGITAMLKEGEGRWELGSE